MPALRDFTFVAMGTDCSLQFFADDDAHAQHVFELAYSEVERLEQRYSRYQANSYLSAINSVAAAGGTIEVDDETGLLLDYAYAAYHKSEGLFDISSGSLRKAWNFRSGRIPDQSEIDHILPSIGLDKVVWEKPCLRFLRLGMELDFGGLVKEYAVDRVAEICLAEGVSNGVINLGGDLCAIGAQIDNAPWQIGIQHPRDCNKIFAVASVTHGALATSGDYVRAIVVNGKKHSHLLSPYTGWPIAGLSSVTILAPTCLVAGSIATIAMLKGQSGKRWLSTLDIDHLWVDDHGNYDSRGPFQIA